MPFKGDFKMIAMRSDDPARICSCFDKFLWNGIARKPCLDGAVVDGKCHTQDRRRGISSISCAARFQAGTASRLVIAVQNAPFDGGVCDATRQRLMHDAAPQILHAPLRCGGRVHRAWIPTNTSAR